MSASSVRRRGRAAVSPAPPSPAVSLPATPPPPPLLLPPPLLAPTLEPPTAVATRSISTDSPSNPAWTAGVQPYLTDGTSAFPSLYVPHTAAGLALTLALVLYFAFWAPPPPPGDDWAPARRAALCATVAFLAYCSIQLRDSLLLRPHPAVWRVVHGAALLYLLALVVLLTLPVESARSALRLADGALGPRPAENDKLYATDCRIVTPGDPGGLFARVYECVADVFIIAHTVGWWAKALLLRDWRLAWALSIGWELLELTFQGVLPNFHECWWDHWVVDVLLCNGLGLYVGMATVRWLEMSAYDWTGREARNATPTNPLGQATALLAQLRPAEFTTYTWRVFERPRNLFVAIGLIALMELVELNALYVLL